MLPSQVKSSLVCAIGGTFFAVLLLVSFLVWLNSSAPFLVLIALLIVLSCIPRFKHIHRVSTIYDSVSHSRGDNAAEDRQPELRDDQQASNNAMLDGETVFQTREKYRVTRPTPSLCWVLFCCEVGLFFVWPLITLFVVGNYPVAGLFIVVGVVSIVRYYFNASVLLKVLGSFDSIGENRSEGDEKKAETPGLDHEWNAKARLNTILLNVTRGPNRRAWIWIFVILAAVIIIFAIESLGTSREDAVSDSQDIVILPLGDFEYPPQPGLPYPSCRLSKGLQIPGSVSTALADYAFLAALAYQRPEIFQSQLDEWFGPNVAKDEVEIVKNFRSEVEGGQAAVSYKLVTFPGNAGVVVVRGSTTSWEWLTDAQLWGGAALVGLYRWLLPVGTVFNPILAQVLKSVSWVESESLQRVALYQQTTSFVRALQTSRNYTSLQITGQSLGGGISLITGAQTSIPAIAVSGPNCLLSRKTFDPPITEDAIDTFLFNIIPERDLVPRIDDPGDLFQKIQCRGKKNDLWACHSSVRSLCEILYTCGSFNRPPPCDCATRYGYPPAMQVGGNQSFTDICGSERSNDG